MSNLSSPLGEQVIYSLKMRYGKKVDIIHFVKRAPADAKTGIQSPSIVERFTIPKAMVLDMDAVRDFSKDFTGIPYGGLFDTEERIVIVPTSSMRKNFIMTETDQLEFIQMGVTIRWQISKIAVSEPLAGHVVLVKRVKP